MYISDFQAVHPSPARQSRWPISLSRTHRGRPYAPAGCGDGSLRDLIPVTIFPKTWDKCRDHVLKSSVLVIKGAISRKTTDDEEAGDIVEILANEVTPIDSAHLIAAPTKSAAKKDTRHIGIYVDITDASPSDMQVLSATLKKHAGPDKPTVRRDGKHVVSKLQISATNDTLKSVAGILGREYVWFE